MSAWEVADGQRVWTPTGEKFHRVTSILGALNKPALVPWAAKLVATRAVEGIVKGTLPAYVAEHGPDAAIDILKKTGDDTRDKAATIGSAVHAAIEALALGQPAPTEYPEEVAGHMKMFDEFLEAYRPKFIMAEATVANRSEAYCGQLDSIVEIGGRRLVLDVKTSKGLYPEVALQLAAYRHAEFIGLDDGTEAPMPETQGAVALHLRPRSWKLVQIETSPVVWNSFLYVREAYRWQKEMSREVIGDKLPTIAAQDEALAAFGIEGAA